MKKTLLVFDNCEHIVEPAAQVISSILRGPCVNSVKQRDSALPSPGSHRTTCAHS